MGDSNRDVPASASRAVRDLQISGSNYWNTPGRRPPRGSKNSAAVVQAAGSDEMASNLSNTMQVQSFPVNANTRVDGAELVHENEDSPETFYQGRIAPRNPLTSEQGALQVRPARSNGGGAVVPSGGVGDDGVQELIAGMNGSWQPHLPLADGQTKALVTGTVRSAIPAVEGFTTALVSATTTNLVDPLRDGTVAVVTQATRDLVAPLRDGTVAVVTQATNDVVAPLRDGTLAVVAQATNDLVGSLQKGTVEVVARETNELIKPLQEGTRTVVQNEANDLVGSLRVGTHEVLAEAANEQMESLRARGAAAAKEGLNAYLKAIRPQIRDHIATIVRQESEDVFRSHSEEAKIRKEQEVKSNQQPTETKKDIEMPGSEPSDFDKLMSAKDRQIAALTSQLTEVLKKLGDLTVSNGQSVERPNQPAQQFGSGAQTANQYVMPSVEHDISYAVPGSFDGSNGLYGASPPIPPRPDNMVAGYGHGPSHLPSEPVYGAPATERYGSYVPETPRGFPNAPYAGVPPMSQHDGSPWSQAPQPQRNGQDDRQVDLRKEGLPAGPIHVARELTLVVTGGDVDRSALAQHGIFPVQLGSLGRDGKHHGTNVYSAPSAMDVSRISNFISSGDKCEIIAAATSGSRNDNGLLILRTGIQRGVDESGKTITYRADRPTEINLREGLTAIVDGPVKEGIVWNSGAPNHRGTGTRNSYEIPAGVALEPYGQRLGTYDKGELDARGFGEVHRNAPALPTLNAQDLAIKREYYRQNSQARMGVGGQQNFGRSSGYGQNQFGAQFQPRPGSMAPSYNQSQFGSLVSSRSASLAPSYGQNQFGQLPQSSQASNYSQSQYGPQTQNHGYGGPQFPSNYPAPAPDYGAGHGAQQPHQQDPRYRQQGGFQR